MDDEQRKSPSARLFVALDLPPSVRLGIGAWSRDALDDPALRRETPTSLHITLAFLGNRTEREIEHLAAMIRARADPAPRVELHDPVARPSPGPPRLFALPAESPDAVSLQADLQQRLVAEQLYEPERRPFWPHVTVARVRSEGGGSRYPRRVSRQPEGLPQMLLQPLCCVRMTLYRSELQPQGALYTPLAQVELSEDGRQ